ncbi:PREDICTED: protein C9orf72 homolog [Propithecus coquereli]|uniref:protein C9orf72 homolog n=1 Tax=Propithecus coquereli TaxID=379532 RepID=UPI00063F0061|nr:PREDICTED: protein C9orf72 homolog [Propithecus coquereli]
MSTLCPPPSPAVAKTEIALSGESPLLAATFAYWDNILGPRVRHIWAPKTEQVLLSDGEITFLANHTLNGEILRNAESGAIDVKFFVLSEKGVIIVSLIFDGNWNGDRSTYGLSIILPQTELSFYLPLHRVCVDRLTHIIRKGRIWMHKIADTVLNDDDIGDSCHEGFLLNAISSHLQTCGCSVVVGSSAEKVNKFPSSVVWHLQHRRCCVSRMGTSSALTWFIFMQVFQLQPGLSLRSTFLAQFLLVLHRKALTLIKYIEDDTQKGKKPFKSLRNLKIDLDLTAEGDLNIIMALAEKIKPGLHSFIFGRPFYTSVQERDVLMTF